MKMVLIFYSYQLDYQYIKLYMHSSNAFSDYMVSYSVNRSINFSPTSGRVHKHKQKGSYGPTICLMNRSREKHEESTSIQKKQEPYLQKIFMLMMEIERLNQKIKQNQKQQQEQIILKKSREFFQLHEQNEKLKKSLVRYENMQINGEKRYDSQIREFKEQLSMLEVQNKSLVRKLRQYQREIEQLQTKKRTIQERAQKTKLQASRMQMSMQFNSTNIDLQKSIAKQKLVEVQSLREKIMKCQDIINDQRYLISGQKEQINKERMRQSQIQNKYIVELQYMKKQVQFTQKEYLQIGQNEAKRYEGELNSWKSKYYEIQQDLKNRCILIANQAKDLCEKEEKFIEINQKLHDLQFQCHSKVIRAEESVKLITKQKQRQIKKVNNEMKKYIQQNTKLNLIIEQFETKISQKDMLNERSSNDLQIRLKQKEKEIKKMIKKKHEQTQQVEQKMNKSLSVDNSLLSNRLRASQVNLEHIVSTVNELKVSNERTTKLIGRTINKAVNDIYYAN